MKKIVVANWKMNPVSLKEAERLFGKIVKSIPRLKNTDVVVCPPVLYLEELEEISKKIILGAQNVFGYDVGPHTGEVSSEMLYNIGARYTIVGHSERREMGEKSINISKKIKALLSSSITPILCIGEKERDENHGYFNVVKTELLDSLADISKDQIPRIIIAYEPIWAIGNGAKPATATEFFEMNLFIKKVLSDKFGMKMTAKVRILYGGSVDEKNAEEFIKVGKADGFLVGRASLDVKKFSEIVKICEVSNR